MWEWVECIDVCMYVYNCYQTNNARLHPNYLSFYRVFNKSIYYYMDVYNTGCSCVYHVKEQIYHNILYRNRRELSSMRRIVPTNKHDKITTFSKISFLTIKYNTGAKWITVFAKNESSLWLWLTILWWHCIHI